PEAADAVVVRRTDLDECHVQGEPTVLEQARDFGQREGHVVHLARASQFPHVAPDIECAMPERARGPSIALDDRAIGQEMDELDAGRRQWSDSRACSSLRGVAQAFPTKTWSPGRMACTAFAAVTARLLHPPCPSPPIAGPLSNAHLSRVRSRRV